MDLMPNPLHVPERTAQSGLRSRWLMCAVFCSLLISLCGGCTLRRNGAPTIFLSSNEGRCWLRTSCCCTPYQEKPEVIFDELRCAALHAKFVSYVEQSGLIALPEHVPTDNGMTSVPRRYDGKWPAYSVILRSTRLPVITLLDGVEITIVDKNHPTMQNRYQLNKEHAEALDGIVKSFFSPQQMSCR